ncbi:G-protein coupled receptor [Biomphalaria glabrata]|nr:putative G-protein coupled receptor [Biomphalaria glabrata]KAI8745252.1 putative G-protein coupled receptor [Biomphalaria glabrata]
MDSLATAQAFSINSSGYKKPGSFDVEDREIFNSNLWQYNNTLKRKFIYLWQDNNTLKRKSIDLWQDNNTLKRNFIDLWQENNTLKRKSIDLRQENNTSKRKFIDLLEDYKTFATKQINFSDIFFNISKLLKFKEEKQFHANLNFSLKFDMLHSIIALWELKMRSMLQSFSYNTFAVFNLRSSLTRLVRDLVAGASTNFSQTSLGKEIERATCGTDWTIDQTSTFPRRLLEIMKCYVNPTMSVVGIGQNLMCLAILRKDGIRRTFNIFLMSMIVAGIFQQMMSLNVAEIIEHLKGSRMYHKYDKYVCFRKIDPVFEIFKMFFIFIGTWGQLVFSSTYMLITVDRLLIVYLPLRARSIISIKSVITCNILVFFVWLPWVVFKTFCYYTANAVYLEVKLRLQTQAKYHYFSVCYHNLTETGALVPIALSKCFPLSIVLIGSLAIAIKIKVILSERKHLTKRNRTFLWSNQTTKTLLTTCSVFSVTEVLLYFFSYIVSRESNEESVWLSIHLQLIYFAYLITTSSTFFIFIFTNKKLMKHFMEITKLFSLK